MLLPTLEKRIRNPKDFEAEFAAFWKEIGAKLVQEKTVAQAVRYDSLALATGTNKFFDTAPVAFETNMNSFTPPETEHFLITRMRLAVGVNAVLLSTDWTYGADPAVEKNGQLSITNNGVRVLDRYPLSDFIPDLLTRDVGTVELEEPIAWIGQTILTAQIELNAAPAANSNMRFELIGIAYIS